MATIFENELSRGEMRKQNPENFNVVLNGRRMRPPDAIIHIYSVARRDVPVRHWAYPYVTLSGCKNGERYVKCLEVPDPVLQVSPDLERGGNRVDEHDGWRVSIDLLNPANISNDPWADTRSVAISRGGNLIMQGFFPSHNDPPLESELKKAEANRDTYYDRLTKEAFRLETVSTKELNDYLVQTPQVHEAMDALGLQASWHKRREVTATCPNCGDPIRPNVAFHQSSAGIMCVLDAERALKAGAINRKRYEELQPTKTEV